MSLEPCPRKKRERKERKPKKHFIRFWKAYLYFFYDLPYVQCWEYIMGEPCDEPEASEEAMAITVSNDKTGNQGIWMARIKRIDAEALSTLVHESFHATSGILRTRGVTFSDDSEEAYAYLQSHIFHYLIKTLEKELGVQQERERGQRKEQEPDPSS